MAISDTVALPNALRAAAKDQSSWDVAGLLNDAADRIEGKWPYNSGQTDIMAEACSLVSPAAVKAAMQPVSQEWQAATSAIRRPISTKELAVQMVLDGIARLDALALTHQERCDLVDLHAFILEGARIDCWYSLSLYTDADLDEIDAAIDRLTNICPEMYAGVSISEIESGEIPTDDWPDELVAVAEALHTARKTIVESISATSDERSVSVEIEADHDAMIRAAGGDDDCDHDWTAEGEGGCDENPGVWSVGGTAMTFATHCRKCGLHRTEHSTGSQRNPGEHDTTTYEQPSSWCADCEREECNCDDD